jgi:hypothetical protein
MKYPRQHLLDLLEQAQTTAKPAVSAAIDAVLLPHLIKRAEECDSMARWYASQGYPGLGTTETREAEALRARARIIAERMEAALP